MSRLADYFAVVGYDHEKARSGNGGGGRIIQRFPETDWDDCPFTQGLELFCQPAGWQLTTQKQQPTFFISVLTDIDADRHYSACLTFTEDVIVDPPKVDDEDPDDTSTDPALVRASNMFAPKSLVLISRLDYFEVFRNCLGLIYTVHIENMQVELEALVGNILGCIQVPPPGGPQIRFSIGAGDRQALQPPLSSTLPVTHTCVAMLFQQLGIANSLSIFCAALADHKVLFHSQSYTRLTDASHAVTSLMYPLKYSYVYIPLLPVGLIEVLCTPTPFIAGVHTSIKPDVSDLLDVIVADLDGGSIHVPDHIKLSLIPEPIYARALNSLYLILRPDLLSSDHAFPPSPSKTPPLEILDKEIRAVFLRMFAELYFGYRSCLTIIRIHPEPVITFHKANFLGHRGLVEDEFTTRVLDSMSYSAFVAERGPPYRVCDIFDEVFATITETLKNEAQNPDRLLHNIKDLAQQLYLNENPNPQPYVQKVPKPTDGAHMRIHQAVFPKIDRNKVRELMEEGLAKQNVKSKLVQMRPQQPRIVPMGPHVNTAQVKQCVVPTNVRRLEVLRNCVGFIFDNKISDARKIFPAVLRALKTKKARLALTEELSFHVQSNRAMLEHQQFDLVVRLLNCALQNDSSMDEHGVAAAILPLATAFCRKLCTGVIQFAYTCVQEHAVWANTQFWEATFYQDVQREIRQLYLPQYEEHLVPNRDYHQGPSSPREKLDLNGSWSRDSWRSNGSTPDAKRRSVTHNSSMFKPRQISGLEIAAEQLRVWPTLGEEKQAEMINNEESTVYSQAIHYANRMVYMRVPLDTSKSLKEQAHAGTEGESTSSNITNSIAESDSMDAESGFDEQEVSEVGANVVKFVSRFVDKVCTQSNVTSDHVKCLHQMVPGVVAMHMEILEGVFQESKRLPPIQKPKILTPTLLPGEEIVMEGLRVYLVPDGREEATGGNTGGPTLLPAEGAVFLTTYRILFKGTPCDPLACEQVVCRSFPVSTITREKKISVQYLSHIDQWLQEGLQLRSNTFQLMKVAFDEEVNADDVETLRKLVHKVRNPPSVMNTFAFTGLIFTQPSQLAKSKEKNASLKGFAKRTLMKTAKKAGFKSKENPNKRQKYVLPTPPMARRALVGYTYDSKDRPVSMYEDHELSVIDEQEIAMAIQTDAKNVDRLAERLYCRDFTRLGLSSLHGNNTRGRTEPFRLTMVNTTYTVCRSYPAVLCVPQSITDASIQKFARSHRQYRFPVATWRHPKTKAVLLRASGFHGKGVMGMLKGHHNAPSGNHYDEISLELEQVKYFSAIVAGNMLGTSSEVSSTTTTMEQEKYFSAVVATTPMGNQRCLPVSGSDSLTSLDSLLLAAGAVDPLSLSQGDTPDLSRRNPLARAVNSLRSSGGKAKSGPSLMSVPTMQRQPQASKPRQHAPFGFARMFGSLRGKPERASFGAGSSSQREMESGEKKSSISRAHSLRDRRPLSAGYGGQMVPKQNGTIDLGDLGDAPQGLHKAALYILGEKNQMKGIKMESFPKCDFIPVDFHEVRHVKSSFKKLMRACVPSAPYTDPEKGYLKAIEDSEWLNQLQSILQIAGATVDLLDVQGSSVMICLEDGWDFSTQVVSVAQILMDPYYRTVEGFQTLVEKEWLSFGHRFTHRSNQTAATQASGFAPIFLQFLDAVHQIYRQFPLSFEFNQYYLKFLAYHYVSNRFRTFMLDNEFERVEAGWLLEDRNYRPDLSLGEDENTSPSHSTPSGSAVWDFINKYHKDSSIFFNFMYSPAEQEAVLRPYSNVSNLAIWDYYLKEDLAHGPSFDLDVVAREQQQLEDQEMVDGPLHPSQRRIINGCYDNIDYKQPDSCTFLIQEIIRLETELGYYPSKWDGLWSKLEHPSREQLTRQVSFNTQLVRSHGRSIHKRSTIELLVKGKMLGEAAKMFSQPHRFEKFTYTTPAYCDYCSHVLWGLVKTGMRCMDCGYNCHEKCMAHVPKNCTRLRPVSEASTSSTNISKGSIAETASMTGVHSTAVPAVSLLQGPRKIYSQFSSAVSEHRTYEGYLYKRGALLKGWKQRWFVLDSMKHQLRYYDSKEDSMNCKGFIDLAEVEKVASLKNVQGAPKKADENASFELKTSKRVYNFLASDANAAQEWIEQIHGCIQ